MNFKLNKDAVTLLLNHAVEEYPQECVGAILSPKNKDSGVEIIRLTNEQNSLHDSDPKHFERDGTIGYFVDTKEVFSLVRRVEKEGRKILSLYHSHPNHGSYFSDEDHNGAVMWGEPVYPDVVYIVISVYDGKVKEAVIFSWDGSHYIPSGKLDIES